MIYENGLLLAESERFPKRTAARWPTSTWIFCAPSGCGGNLRRQPSSPPTGLESFRRVGFHLDPPGTDLGLRRGSNGSRSCPTTIRLEQDCYGRYNIRVSGLEQRLRALSYPKGRHRGLRRPGFHPR